MHLLSRSSLRAAALLAALAASAPLPAQVSYATAGSSYVQNFNGGLPAASNNAATWTDNSTANFTGWSVYRELNGTPSTYRINSATSSGDVQHFRSSASATDGAFGGRPNDSTGKVHYGVRLRNATGATLRTFTLSYALEQWYRSGTANANELRVSFKLGNPANLADDSTWGLITPLTLAAPQTGGTAGDLTGSDSANRVASTAITVGGFEWADGTDLWIRISDDNDGGVDQGLAIDDFTFSAATTATVPVGGVSFGRNGYIEYQPGDSPLIIVTGHGGREQPAEIPDRTYGAVDEDLNTQDLARKIVAEILARTGQRPHLIVNRLHRVKLDPNREIVEAAQGDPEAEIAWNEFHDYIRDARDVIEPAFGFGFLVDIHGHAHAIDRLEFGYNLGAAELNQSDAELRRPAYAEDSSLRTHTYRPGIDFPALLRGARSLGDLLERRNYPSVPSPTNPGPGANDYFEGGYNIEEHGSLQDTGNIQAVQIEAHYDGVRDTDANRAAFAGALATSLHDFLYDQFGYALGSGSLFTLSASTDRLHENGSGLTLTVTRSGHLANAETIALDFGGSAVRNTDYTASATSVSFAVSETQKTITLTPTNDAAAEGAETIVVALAPTALQTADVLPLTLALSDDDRASVHVVAQAATATEGGSTVNVDVTRDLVSGTLQTQLHFTGTAVRGVDYDVTGLDSLDRVSFANGVATQTIGLVPLNDSVMEPAKTIVVTAAPGASHATGVPAAATVRLTDNDLDAALELWFADRIDDGAWRDESGHGRDGAFRPYGATGPATAAGVAGTAVEFDGADDAVVTPHFPVGPAEFTLTFRFRLDPTATSTAFRHLFNLGGYDEADSLTIFRVESNNNLRTLLHDANEAPANTALDVTGITANSTWRHYALTVSTTNGLRVYIDGVSAASVGSWSGSFAPQSALWFGWRGAYNLIASRHLDGAMEDIRLYSRALSAAEVAAVAAVPARPPAGPSSLSATATSSSQIDLAWTDNSGDETGFEVERSTDGVNFSLVATAAANATAYAETGLSGNTTYHYRVRATNAHGDSPASNPATATTPPAQVAVTFTSVAAHDGWVLESGENTNAGGSTDSTALRAGDNNQDRQYRTLVSFDTSSIPDGATIVSATLKLRRSGVTGTNPFGTHGTCHVDIKGGTGFGGATALATGDFQAAADATQVAALSNAANNNDWSTGALNGTGLAAINKTGHTQFRVAFATDDNDDNGNDYITWYPGDNATSANRPVLEIVYQ